MSAIFIARGDCHLGTVRRDADGNAVEHCPAKFETSYEGGCIAICDMDPEKMELVGAAEVDGDWQAAHFLARVLEKLGPGRDLNIPDFRDILKRAVDDGQDTDFFCDFCKDQGCYQKCRDCIVTEWKEDVK